MNGSRQQYQQQPWQLDGIHPPVWGREEDNSNFITPENSLLSYDSSANSGKNQNFTRNHPSLWAQLIYIITFICNFLNAASLQHSNQLKMEL